MPATQATLLFQQHIKFIHDFKAFICYYFSWEFYMSISVIQVSSQNLILRESFPTVQNKLSCSITALCLFLSFYVAPSENI